MMMAKKEKPETNAPQISQQWVDFGRMPFCQPNPLYPDGVDVDLAGKKRSCKVELHPYPAPRIGAHYVKCARCGVTAMVTTAGRQDDPRSVKLACKRTGIVDKGVV